MRFKTNIQNKPAPRPFLKIQTHGIWNPCYDTGEVRNKGHEKQKGKVKVFVKQRGFFLVPAKVFWVTWQCPVTPIQLSTSGRVDTAAAGHWLLPIWDTQVPGDGYSYQHTWNFDRTQYLCVDNFAPLWASFDSFPQLSGSWKEVRGSQQDRWEHQSEIHNACLRLERKQAGGKSNQRHRAFPKSKGYRTACLP